MTSRHATGGAVVVETGPPGPSSILASSLRIRGELQSHAAETGRPEPCQLFETSPQPGESTRWEKSGEPQATLGALDTFFLRKTVTYSLYSYCPESPPACFHCCAMPMRLESPFPGCSSAGNT